LLSAVRGFERKVLSFCYCVRTRFADVNIFDNPSTTGSRGTAASIMQIETLMQAMAGLLERIAVPADFNLTSSPETFNSTMLRWLTDPSFHLPNGSIVGLCCSSLLGLQFQEEKESAADGLVDDFKQFLLATSLVHAGWKDQRVGKGDDKKRIRTRELYAASQMTGSRLLKRLDRILTPQFLGKCGRESCQVLFLLVLGAALGVAYASSSVVSAELRQRRLELVSSDALWVISSPLLPTTTTPASSASSLSPVALLSPEFRRSPTLWLAMKEHLCQMLAHHLIFIGSMLGIKLDTVVEQHIIDTAVARWNKAEEYVWANAVPVIPTPGKKAGGRKVEEGAQRESSEKPRDPLREGGLEDAGSTDGETKAPTHRPPMPPPPLPRLAPIPCPEIKEFHPEVIRDWGQNPQSFLDMFNEDFDFDTPSVDNKTTDGDCSGEAGCGQKRKSPLTTTPDLERPSRDLGMSWPWKTVVGNAGILKSDRIARRYPRVSSPTSRIKTAVDLARTPSGCRAGSRRDELPC
jgi:hypothetical protein